jgi:methyl-accepting chemotaxis protein-4 (peptide sensor receptor)
MLQRIRISTCLLLLLLVFAAMELISNGLSLKASYDDSLSMMRVANSSEQRDALSRSWALLLQTRNTLNRAATRVALQQPATAITPLLEDARKTLQGSEVAFQQFVVVPRSTARGIELTEVLKTNYKPLHDILLTLADLLEKGQMQAFLDAPAQKYQDQYQKNVSDYMELVNQRLVLARQEAEAAYNHNLLNVIVMIICIVLLTAAALVITQRILFRPLSQMREHFERIGAGDISQSIPLDGRYEIRLLQESLQQMQHSLAATVSSVRHGAHMMFNGLKEIAVGNNDLASRTEEQASSLEQTSASMEQLTATVKQNADNARQATQLSVEASSTASKGGTLTDNVVQTMNDIASSSQKISAITSVIDSIAFQTNILALNAAVEAARAGEQGRGFAVVAGEVRNLAQRSAQAAKEIKGLIDESVDRVKQGSSLVASAGSTMQEIVSAVTRVSDIMSEISSASDEQSRGIELVSQAVTQMDQVTQQNSALVQQVSAATRELEQQSETLTQTVAVFRLAEGEPNAVMAQKKATRTAADTLRRPNLKATAPASSTSHDDWETF